MRILQVVQGFPPQSVAGVQVYTYNISKELSKKHEVHVFYPVKDLERKDYSSNKGNYNGLQIIEINNKPNKNLLHKQSIRHRFTCRDKNIDREFKLLLDELRPDIVHFQHLIGLSTSLIRLCKKKGIPAVLTLHDYWFMCHRVQLLRPNNTVCIGPDEKGLNCLQCYIKTRNSPHVKFGLTVTCIKDKIAGLVLGKNLKLYWKGVFLKRNTYLKKVLDEVDLLIAPSNFLMNKFIEYGVFKEKIVFSSYGMDTKLFDNFKRKRSKRIRFGYTGQIVFHKGVHVLIEAFNKVQKSNVELKIYGAYNPDHSLYHRDLRKKCTNSNVKFMGRFKSENVSKPYSEIDVLVVPSVWYENCPLVIQEAFITRTPVIASKIGALPEFVRDRKTGFLFNVGDSDDLYQKINLITEDPNLIEEFKKNINPVKTIKYQAKELEKIYKRLFRK